MALWCIAPKNVIVTFSPWTCTIALLTVKTGTAEQWAKESACHFQSMDLYYSTFNSCKWHCRAVCQSNCLSLSVFVLIQETIAHLTVINGAVLQCPKKVPVSFSLSNGTIAVLTVVNDTVVLRMPALAALFVPGSLHYWPFYCRN